MKDFEAKNKHDAKLIYEMDQDISDFRTLIESNTEDMPVEFSKAIDNNFWDLVAT